MLSLIDTGIVAADDLLAFMLDEPARVEKASAIDILSLPGFDKFVLTLLDKFVRVAEPIERRALGALLRGLDQDWPGMTPAARSDAIRDAGEAYLGISASQGPRIGAIIRNAGEEVHNLTMVAAKEQFDLRITPHLSAIDRRVIDSAAQANALFIRDQAGKRSELLSIRARNVAAQGLEAGYDGATIAEMMGKELAGSAARQNKAYLRIVADAMTGRARSYAALRSLEEAEITHYKIVAVLDEVTTECCRLMDGKVFSVTHTLGKYQEAATASETEPEAVKRVQPWIGQGKDAEGRGILYVKRGAEREKIATINAAGIGVSDRKGDYAQHADDAALAHMGVTSPPFHAHCRTTIVPSTETITTSTSAQVPVGFGQGWEEPAPVEVDEPAPLRPEEPARVVTEAESAAIEREVEPSWKPIKPKGGYLNLRAPDFKDADGKKKKIKDPDLEARLANIFTTGSYAYEGVEADALTVEFGPIQSKTVDKTRPYLDRLEQMARNGELGAHTRDYDLNYRGDQYRLTWPNDKFDKARVASFMVGPARGDKAITAVKFDGKIYIHSGADKLAAALIKRETALDVNLVDIDAWRATPAGAKSTTAAEANNTIRLLNSLPAAPTGEGVDTSAFGFTAHVKPTYTGDLASALRRLGATDVEELADRHGAVTPLDFGRDLKHVVGPRTLNRGAVARAIGADLPSPVVIKHGERAWIHSGAESLAAARLGPATGAQVRVIDLDKLGPTTAIDPGEWARRLAPDLDALKNGTATPEQQRAVREGFRGLIAAEGMITRDDLRGTSKFIRNPVMNVIAAEPTRAADVAASHSWVGRVIVGPRYALEAAEAAVKLAVTPTALSAATPAGAYDGAFGIHALIHEEIHGASSIAATAYARDGVGVGIEEALTELLARHVTRKTLGITAPAGSYDTPFGLPSRMRPTSNLYNTNADHGAYNDFIRGLFNQVGEHTGHDDIHDRVERAALKTRAWNGGKSDWQTGEEQVRAFVDALDVEQPEQREALYAALIGPSSPLRP